MRKLTIGMCVYNDYDGVYFTLQSLRLHHSEVMNNVEFVIVNNSKDQDQANALKALVNHIKQPIQYIEFTEYESTSVRNKIFEVANTTGSTPEPQQPAPAAPPAAPAPNPIEALKAKARSGDAKAQQYLQSKQIAW
jgi:hypothetical protein